MLHNNQMRPLGLAAALAVAGACGSDAALAPSQLRISIDDGMVTAAVAPLLSASVNGVTAVISPDTVESLEIEFTQIAFLPADADEQDEASEAAWEVLTLDAATTLDLMALPTEEEGSIVIGAGTVLAGSYRKVRILAAAGEIVFKGPIDLGGAAAFDGGMPYAVTIPSGAQTGLKTDVSFEVTEGENATANAAYVVFVPGTTFQNVTVTGNGGVMLAPVLRSGTN